MRVVTFDSAADYLVVAERLLAADPVSNQLPLALPRAVRDAPALYPGGLCCLAAIDDEGACVAFAVQTAPWPMQLSVAPPEGATALGRHAATTQAELVGVMGPRPAAQAFASAFGEVSGATAEVDQEMGVYVLTAVAELPLAAGSVRVAEHSDAALLAGWMGAFHAEAVPNDPAPGPDIGRNMAAAGRTWLWLDVGGAPVCVAHNAREVDGFHSVGPVYTPPEHRGRGFATALVSTLSSYLLARGRGCTLFANLADPTSNAVYERIGYRRVGAALKLSFLRSSRPGR
jgi:predicted GNAT family acetyltransferase